MDRQKLFSLIDRTRLANTDPNSVEMMRLREEMDFFEQHPSLYRTLGKLVNQNFKGSVNKANCYLSYLIGVTDVCCDFDKPLNLRDDYYLVRYSPPDIDTDFEDITPVQAYITQKYGADHVAPIGTFGNWKVKGALQNASKYHGLQLPSENGEVMSISDTAIFLSKLVDTRLNEDFDAAINEANFAAYRQAHPELDNILVDAKKIFGIKASTGKHAGGIIITDEPIAELIPLHFSKEEDTKKVIYITQFDMHDCEELGCMKMDTLGVKTLRVVHMALNMIKARHGKDIDIWNLNPFDTQTAPSVINLIAKGITKGIFQFEKYGFTKFLMELQPTCFDDLVAGVALYRPGPLANGYHNFFIERKSNASAINYPHPALYDILKSTLGLFIYQEQLMKTCQILAGFTKTEADEFRKIIGKKDVKKLPEMAAKFRARAKETGLMGDAEVSNLWDQFEKFGNYCFNKAHSAAYAYLAYATAFLKALFPREFYSALLTVELNSGGADCDENLEYYEREATRYFNIKFLPVDINHSKNVYTIEDDKIRKPLSCIKGVGTEAQREICANQPYNTFQDFYLGATTSNKVSKSVVECLINAGALNCFGSEPELKSEFIRCQGIKDRMGKGPSKNKTIPRLKGVF